MFEIDDRAIYTPEKDSDCEFIFNHYKKLSGEIITIISDILDDDTYIIEFENGEYTRTPSSSLTKIENKCERGFNK